ncbi:NAD-dependent epimerase/dehydratase family protein [Microbacterium allomyrinae]|uniref:NAD-dependent epimerase/dehydratase family protein n=1 Tax=Microbacterium allomyrinae TaxID=2830666 RepID=A0A9X1S4N1_9MICO|nr:NAD-dependent epimerase/dehydratase family protein [Microbacterium allomyrinae]MCC2033672.1 NAD-dependent epimerase/dehydratase family protein [Microbacterium allomyrinae]
MKILLTGATGYIGSAVLDVLVEAGHRVLAPVRSESAAAVVTARGATAAVGDLSDVAWSAGLLADTDAAIHVAASDDSARLNLAVAEAVEQEYGGTGRRFILTSGIWEYGAGDDIRGDDVPNPPALVAWRVPIEERLLASAVATTIIVPGVVYGRDKGLLSLIVDAPRTADGALTLIGDGAQHWTWVHVDDLARLYLRVLEHPAALGRVIASDGASQTVRAVAEAAGSRAVSEPIEATRARLGAAFADALLLDQQADGAEARALGWIPEHASVLGERALDRRAAVV